MTPDLQKLLARPDVIARTLERKRQPLYAYFATSADRAAYAKHIEFFAAGANYAERAFVAGNRVGKTAAGAYELACHLTGEYPAWWPGRRLERPVRAWVAGDTGKTVRDILQAKLLGTSSPPEFGMIPVEKRGATVGHRGLAGAVESISVEHASGGYSSLSFKSYDQRREAFQGTALDVIWLDEECPLDIYTECLTRTMTTGGMIYLTFTPLMGLSKLVESFMPGGSVEQCPPHKWVLLASWDDAPHLTEESKTAMLSSIPEHQRLARSRGVPQLGSGAIFRVPEDEILVEPFEIPAHWRRCSGSDVGWQAKSTVWLAHDPASDIVYIVDTFKRGGIEPDVHKAAVAGRGKWIPGVIDPSAIYRDLGIDRLDSADNDVEAGLYDVECRLTTGRLKLFRSCSKEFLDEYRVYRRDEKGKIVKTNDHLLDCLRYAVRSGLAIARPKPVADAKPKGRVFDATGNGGGGWMKN